MAMTRPLLDKKLKVAQITSSDAGALLNQRVCKIITKGEVEQAYLYSYLQSPIVANYIEKLIFGSDPPNISASQIESIKVPIPTKSELLKINNCLTSIASKIEITNAKLLKINSLQLALMQDLLTGKVRVPVN